LESAPCTTEAELLCPGVSDPHSALECLQDKTATQIDQFSQQCLTIIERYTTCVNQQPGDGAKPKPAPQKPGPRARALSSYHRNLQAKPKPKPDPEDRPCWAGGGAGVGGADGEGDGFAPVDAGPGGGLGGRGGESASQRSQAPAPRTGSNNESVPLRCCYRVILFVRTHRHMHCARFCCRRNDNVCIPSGCCGWWSTAHSEGLLASPFYPSCHF
jgi:hypothetical protein